MSPSQTYLRTLSRRRFASANRRRCLFENIPACRQAGERNWLGPACVETSAGGSAGGHAAISRSLSRTKLALVRGSKCEVKIPLSPLEFTPHNPEGICAGPASPCLPAEASAKEGLARSKLLSEGGNRSGKDDFKFFFGGKFF
jgi:hypothetical protein